MLKIFNDLEPFFKDNYRRINVREYARMRKTTPPTASKLLAGLQKDGLLKMEKDRNYIFYLANRESRILVHLSRTYWLMRLENSGLIKHFENELVTPTVVLFGSFSKAEVKQDSDMDLAVFTVSEKTLHLEGFEKKLGRKIHLFTFKSRDSVKNTELVNNILNGLILSGGW